MSKQKKIIKIPHLPNLNIIVYKKEKGDLDEAGAYSQRMCAEEYNITLKLPIKGPKTASDLVHEIIHILQYICEDWHMNFINEREHLAYIAGYIFDEICDIK